MFLKFFKLIVLIAYLVIILLVYGLIVNKILK